MKIHDIILATCFFLLITGNVSAASFDCAKASSEVEKLICSDAELSKLDESLSKAYLQALKRTDIKKQTIESQRQWLKNERNACRNAECVKKAYEIRIKELGLSSSFGFVFLRPADRSASSSEAPLEPSKPQAGVRRKLLKKGPKEKPRSFLENGKTAFELDFESFEKEKDFSDEPFAFSSNEAKELWTFLVSKEPNLKIEPKDMRFNLGSFAKLGPDSYLIRHHALFYAQPRENMLTQLAGYLPPGNWDLGEIRRLGKDKFWLLLSGRDYNHDVGSEEYHALIFEKKPDSSFAPRSVYIAGFVSRGFEDAQRDGLCGDKTDPDLAPLYPTLESAEHVDKVNVLDVNRDGRDDVIFHTTEQDCRTKKIQTRKRTFLNMETCFVEENPGVTIFYLDDNYNPVVKLERLGPMSDGMRAILALYALQNGAGCSGGNENLHCSLTDSLDLGGQCSTEHINLIRSWFKKSIPDMSGHGGDTYINVKTPGRLESICYKQPEGATYQKTWDAIRVTQNGNRVLVDARGTWLAHEKTGGFRYITEYRISNNSVTVISHKEAPVGKRR